MARTWNKNHSGTSTATGHAVGDNKRRRAPAQDIGKDNSPVGVGQAQAASNSLSKGEAKTRYQQTGGKLRKALGKGWQKKVYGKKFVGGTLKGLNEQISERRDRTKSLNEKTRELESKLATGSNKEAIENRLNKLEENKQTVNANLTNSKDSRQHYLNMRDKALSKLENMSPAEKKALRDRAAKKKLKKYKAPESTNGGTEAK